MYCSRYCVTTVGRGMSRVLPPSRARLQSTYHEYGADYDDRHHTERAAPRAIQTLEQQGYRVTLERVA
jgi:hypothetical protein